MKAISVVSALIATISQVALFLGLWALAYFTADSQGRASRSDFGFDITISYGMFLIGFLCLVSSAIAAFDMKIIFRWIAIAISTAIWGYWMIPSFGYHPYRGPVYFSIGCLVLVVGSIAFTPFIKRALQSRHHPRGKTGEQAAT
jgi:hypothetical protein